MRDKIVVTLAILTGVAASAAVVWMSYQFQAQNIYSTAHPKGWVKRYGHVVSIQPTDFSQTPPYVPADVSYRDAAGVTQRVGVDMPPDTTHVGERVRLDVNSADESIIVYPTVDSVHQTSDWPYPGAPYEQGTWPGIGFFLAVVTLAVIGFGAGLLYDLIGDWLASLSGRLGTR